MKFLTRVSLSIFLSITCANTVHAIFEKEYESLNSKAGIRCNYYSESPLLQRISDEVIFNQHIKTNFRFDTTNFAIKVSTVLKEVFFGPKEETVADLIFNGGSIQGEIKRGNFINFDLSSLDSSQTNFSDKVNLRSLSCAVEIAVETQYPIKADRIHINVHPHTVYDGYDRTTSRVNEFFSESALEQVVLLDDYNRKAEGYNIAQFLKGESRFNYKQLQTSEKVIFPKQFTAKVSPAGHNNYVFNRSHQTIEYTGGNHNYCMWNNTRRILDAFFKGQDNNTVIINYHAEAIVVQGAGIIDGLSVPRRIYKQTNLLKDVLSLMNSKEIKEYHSSYYNYFKNSFLSPKRHLFSKINFVYNSEIVYSEQITGTGDKEFTIELNYL